MDSRSSESNNFSQQYEDGIITKNKSCDSIYETGEISNSSIDNSSCDESEYGDVPSVEAFCREEETICGKDSNFSFFLLMILLL